MSLELIFTKPVLWALTPSRLVSWRSTPRWSPHSSPLDEDDTSPEFIFTMHTRAKVAAPTHHCSTRMPVSQSWCSPLDSSPSQLYGGQRHTIHHHHSRPPCLDGVVDREFAETPPTADAAKPVPWR